MKKIALLLIIFLIIPIYVSAARLKVHLRELNPNKKRELVMAPEVGNGKELNRESILVPSASVENGVINIETELASWGVAITIYNSDGMRMLLQ